MSAPRNATWSLHCRKRARTLGRSAAVPFSKQHRIDLLQGRTSVTRRNSVELLVTTAEYGHPPKSPNEFQTRPITLITQRIYPPGKPNTESLLGRGASKEVAPLRRFVTMRKILITRALSLGQAATGAAAMYVDGLDRISRFHQLSDVSGEHHWV